MYIEFSNQPAYIEIINPFLSYPNKMKSNPLSFAVVREDPQIEFEIIQKWQPNNLLMIASAGCTAFSIASKYPDIKLTLVDINPSQIDLIQQKTEVLKQYERSGFVGQYFNIESSYSDGLTQCGKFESLFRQFKSFIYEFVAPMDVWTNYFYSTDQNEYFNLEPIFRNPYWNTSFDLFFSNSLLNTMFGPHAIQHAIKDSYPSYFKQVIENGLLSPLARNNYFLHHIFLGHYINRPEALPYYLNHPPTNFQFDFFQGIIQDRTDLSTFDFINLSNIMDWMSPTEIDILISKLILNLQPGTIILWRQLNNYRNLTSDFTNHFTFFHDMENQLLSMDRSLFYSSLHIGVRNE